ncbi:MAG TPA: hypothetical protein DEB24_06550, partial [Coriobacteriia bacterium]|nr:hypothetical protein [Coriobacteriia bacterium]
LIALTVLMVLGLSGCGTTPENEPASNALVDGGTTESEATPEPTPPTPEQVENQELTLQLNIGSGSYTGSYSGGMLNDLPQGQGEFLTTGTSGKPRSYTGGWNEGHFEGEGLWKHGDRKVYEGTFKNDRLVNGTIYVGGVHVFYEGEFRDGLRLEDVQARIDKYAAEAVSYAGGAWSNYVGKIVALEEELVDVVQRPSAVDVELHVRTSDGGSASIMYYPAYGEVLPQPGSRILAYYRIVEDTSESGEVLPYLQLGAFAKL